MNCKFGGTRPAARHQFSFVIRNLRPPHRFFSLWGITQSAYTTCTCLAVRSWPSFETPAFYINFLPFQTARTVNVYA